MTENIIFMKAIFSILIVATIAFTSCTRKPFDRILPTELERYSIVYKNNLCGVYDNHADSVVVDLIYNDIHFVKSVYDPRVDYTVWECENDTLKGHFAIKMQDNGIVELLFPIN